MKKPITNMRLERIKRDKKTHQHLLTELGGASGSGSDRVACPEAGRNKVCPV